MKKYLEILNRDRLKNISIINFIENNPIDGVEVVENSLIVHERSNRDWVYIACPNQSELNLVKDKLNVRDTCFGAIEDWMIPTLTKDRDVLWNLALIEEVRNVGKIPFAYIERDNQKSINVITKLGFQW